MSRIATRLTFGFIAGAVSYVVFRGALGVLYHGAGIIPLFCRAFRGCRLSACLSR